MNPDMTRARILSVLLLLPACLSLLTTCGGDGPPKKPEKPTLAEARVGFETTLVRKTKSKAPLPEPPPDSGFDLIKYPGPPGEMHGLVSSDPGDGRKYPAMIWIVGGFENSISDIPWNPGPPEDDQSASAFSSSGIITMFPALRGGNGGPGFKEGLFGEVDDVIAAAEFLATLEYVNPGRIYLGGHSVGGTLVLLVAESTDSFRAVFSFGPVESTAFYGPDYLPFNTLDADESRLRAPASWLHAIKNPTYIFEGRLGNIDSLQALKRANDNPLVRVFAVPETDHFGVLQPVSELAARKIIEDIEGESAGIEITPLEIVNAISGDDPAATPIPIPIKPD